jgi:hypothetical protein
VIESPSLRGLSRFDLHAMERLQVLERACKSLGCYLDRAETSRRAADDSGFILKTGLSAKDWRTQTFACSPYLIEVTAQRAAPALWLVFIAAISLVAALWTAQLTRRSVLQEALAAF